MSEEMTETMEATAPEAVPAAPVKVENINDLKSKMKVTGTVKRLELYGAFIDIGVDANALIHISQLSDGHVNRVNDVLSVGDEVEVWVNKVDTERQQVMVTMVEPLAVEWGDLKRGQVYTGTVSRLENFGAFINIGAEREGLVHISELSHDYVKSPQEVVNVGDEVEVQVLNFSKRKRRIDLSMKALMDKPEAEYKPVQEDYAEIIEDEEEDFGELPTAMEIAIRRAMGEELQEIDSAKGKGGNNKGGRKQRRQNKRRSREEIYNRTLQYERD
ncbi:MAG: S1 RNA-binding domain-containing protein [Chloroflexota bacterium]|jgi:small subunit ribosomal protein S1